MTRHGAVATALILAALAAAPGSPAAAESLTVAIPQKGNWDTDVVDFGVKQGWFKQAGLDVRTIYTQGGAATPQAVISGSVDLGMGTGLLGIVGAYVKGAPLRVISAEMTGAADLYWYARAQSGIRTLKDAAGKTFAYSEAGSSTNLVLLALLDHARIKARPVSTGGIPGTFTQVMSGQIDVGWAVPPFGIKDVEDGRIVIVAHGNDVPAIRGETVRVNIVNSATLQKRRAVIAKFMQIYVKTVDWMYRDPKAIDDFAEATGMPRAMADKARREFFPREGMQPYEVKGLDLVLQQALQFKYIPHAMTPKDVAGLFDMMAKPEAQ